VRRTALPLRRSAFMRVHRRDRAMGAPRRRDTDLANAFSRVV